MQAAAVIIIVMAATFLSDSGRAAQYCGCGLADDQQNFPVYAHALLEDLVTSGPFQKRDPASGYINYFTNNPAFAGKGAAHGSAICARRLTVSECHTCISDAREYLRPCETYVCGGAAYANKCSVEFWQIIE
ncbi:unnamed protein product [Linum trigynum]|uniref:Gnk2-homologous domain-containing protein n=1 Tax=Linum trigynum TaxID=586398 RepID=A0AAV2DAV8_9ROSI